MTEQDDTPALQAMIDEYDDMIDEYDDIVALRFRDLPRPPLLARASDWCRKWRYRCRRARMLLCSSCHGHGLRAVYDKSGRLFYALDRPCPRCNRRP